MGCKAFYSMEDPKGTLRVPSIIWKTSLFFPSILSLYASLFAFVKAKQCWFLYSKGLSLEPPSCFFIYLFLIIIIILAQMDKPIAERKPSKILFFFKFNYFGTNGQNPLEKGHLSRFSTQHTLNTSDHYIQVTFSKCGAGLGYHIALGVSFGKMPPPGAFYPTHNMGLMHSA